MILATFEFSEPHFCPMQRLSFIKCQVDNWRDIEIDVARFQEISSQKIYVFMVYKVIQCRKRRLWRLWHEVEIRILDKFAISYFEEVCLKFMWLKLINALVILADENKAMAKWTINGCKLFKFFQEMISSSGRTASRRLLEISQSIDRWRCLTFHVRI